ncbi:MAG: HNH endonuclease [Myxococcota bacterium]|nr:HNH endonuclease [Myxococcota bacterium]
MRRSFSLVYQGGAKVVNDRYETFDFDSWMAQAGAAGLPCIGTTSGPVPIPKVIVLTVYDRMPRRMVRFSRGNIFSRDAFTCQYCGERPPRAELNLDHVVPRTLKGRTTWENVVCCCVSCNRKKGGRTPEQAGLRLRKKPKRPRWTPLMGLPTASVRHREWRPYLAIDEPARTEISADPDRAAM